VLVEVDTKMNGLHFGVEGQGHSQTICVV